MPAWVLLTLAVFVVGAVAVLPRPLQAQEWSVTEAVIEAHVQPDGSMVVTETRTFAFPASFRWVEQLISTRGSAGLSELEVREGTRVLPAAPVGSETPGTYNLIQYSEEMGVKIWFERVGGTRTFSVTYRLADVVVVHDDVAEIYWKFIGDEWEVGTRKVTVSLHLPSGAAKDEIRAWAHGPLQGQVTIAGPDLVTLSLANLPSETFVEGRVTFPPRLVPASTNWSGKTVLPGILAEEEKLARAANLRRLSMTADVYAGPLLFLLATVLGVRFILRYGREFKPQDRPTYYRELPGDYSPAELGVLWNFGAPSPADLVATILDLARRGWLLIEEIRTEKSRFLGLGTVQVRDYRLWRRAAPPRDDALRNHEESLVGFLFGGKIGRSKTADPPQGVTGSPVLFSDIESYAKANAASMAAFYKRWEKGVQKEAEKRVFFDLGSRKGQRASALTGLGTMFIGTAVLAGLGLWVSAAASFFSGLGFIITAAFLRRRSRYGAEQFWLWRAFRRFLQHFSRLDKAELPALALWDHYLVYAVTLGVAKEVIEQLPLAYSEEQVARTLGSGWFTSQAAMGLTGAAAQGGLIRSIENLSSFTSALTTSLQGSVSSGSGRGGGFSGGGRGGGGGGGGGGGRAGG